MQDIQKKKVLVVDDDAAIQKVLGIILKTAGYSIIQAESGEDALAILKQDHNIPDCIISDIRMPGMSGLDLLNLFKKMLPLVPVVMLTAHTDLDTGLTAMKRGAFDYITKPVRKAKLLDLLEKCIGHKMILEENHRLKIENQKYQEKLENRVEQRTRELQMAYDKLKDTNLATVKVLAETIEAKDPYTRGHSNRVRGFSRQTALKMALSSHEIEILEYGALLHDIGKIGIPEALLHKELSLDSDEKRVFQEHPIIGENILKVVDFFLPCLPIVKQHHEWYNGLGYPAGLKRDEISLLARIVQIADSYDAMTTNRPYREALPREVAVQELEKGRHQQFDSDLVDIFLGSGIYNLDPDVSF